MYVFVYVYSGVNRSKLNLAKTQGAYEGVQYEKSKNKRQRGSMGKRQQNILESLWTFMNTCE